MTFIWGGKQFAPGSQAEFTKWLKAHGHTYNQWAADHPVAAQTFAPNAQWIEAATAASQPQIIALQAAQDKADAAAKQRAENAAGFAKALAGIYSSIGPQIAGTYQAAAGEQGALGKGFGDIATQQAADQVAGQSALFAKAGTPADAAAFANAQSGGPVGDVVYGQGGFIPASTMLREGAAFSAAASNLPAYAGGMGQQDIRKIMHDALLQHSDFDTQLAAVRAGIPAEAERIREFERTSRINERANQAQEAYLRQQGRQIGANITGIDPLTGLPTAEMRQFNATIAANKILNDADNKAKAAHDKLVFDAAAAANLSVDPEASRVWGILVDGNNTPILGPDGKPIKIYEKPSKSGGPGKTNPKSVAAREGAFNTAQKSMYVDVKGLWKTIKGDPHLPTTNPGHNDRRIPPKYEEAKAYLFHKYDFLLKYATRSSRYILKKRLNELIDKVLRDNHIKPTPKKKPPSTVKPGDRPR